MSTQRKITGYVPHNNDRFYGSPGIRLLTIPFNDAKGDSRDIPATLVIGEGKVLTGEEVKAMLASILGDLCDDGVLLSYANVSDQFKRSAASFGITL